MVLRDGLSDVLMEFHCPACSHPMVRSGSWIRTIGSFRCDSCKAMVRIGYEKKLSIFASYLKNQQQHGSGGAPSRQAHQADRSFPRFTLNGHKETWQPGG